MLPFKKNEEETWKPHQANEIYSALLIPRNTFMIMKKEKTVYIF